MRIKSLVVGLLLSSGLAVRAKAAVTEETDDNQFREDVIACEEAVSHVHECCADLSVQADACRYSHYFYEGDCAYGCDEAPGSGATRRDDVWPVVTAAEGHRIAGIDCATMQSRCAEMGAELNRVNETHTFTPGTCDYP